MNKQVVIKASELGEYVFCRRAWWLRHVQGVVAANETDLRAGQQLHARHGGLVRMATWMHFGGYMLVLLAILLVALWLFPHLV